MMYDNAAKCSVVEQTVKQKNGLLPMKRQKGGIQIIIKVTITLASGKKQVISVTVQKTTVRTTKITGLKSSVTVAKNKKTYAETGHQPDHFPGESYLQFFK